MFMENKGEDYSQETPELETGIEQHTAEKRNITEILKYLIPFLVVVVLGLIFLYVFRNVEVETSDNILTFHPKNFSIAVVDGWDKVSPESISLPGPLTGAQFAFEKEGTPCTFAYIRTATSTIYEYKQTSFAERVFTSEGRQLDGDWWLLKGNLPEDFEFEWDGRQSFDGEVRINWFPVSYNDADPDFNNIFVLYVNNGGAVPLSCDKDVSQMLSSIIRVFEPSTISGDSNGIVYISTGVFSGSQINSRSFPLQYLLFKSEVDGIVKRVAELDTFYNRPWPTVYKGALYFVSSDGTLRMLDISPEGVSETLVLEVEEEESVNEFYFFDDHLYYLLGSSCNNYRARCDLKLFGMDLVTDENLLIAEGLSYRSINGYNKKSKSLSLYYNTGDHGCYSTRTSKVSIEDGVITEGRTYSGCNGNEEEDNKEYDAKNAYLSQFSNQHFNNDYILIRDGKIVLTEETLPSAGDKWTIRYIR